STQYAFYCFNISPYLPTPAISLLLILLYPQPYPPTALTRETPINTNEIAKIKIDIIFCIVHRPFNLLFPGWIDLYVNNIQHVQHPIYHLRVNKKNQPYLFPLMVGLIRINDA